MKYFKRKTILIVFLIHILMYGYACADNLSYDKSCHNPNNVEFAQVKRVTDGDTINLFTGGEIIKARLFGIDCMETSEIQRAYKQTYENNTKIEDIIEQGKNAKIILETTIKENNNYVYFKTMGIDKYSRLLVIIYDLQMNNINEQMKKTGFCVKYTPSKK